MKSSKLILGIILGIFAGSIVTFFISQERYDLETISKADAEKMIKDGLVDYDYLTSDVPLFEAMQYIHQVEASNGVEYYKTSHAVVVGDASLDFVTTGYTDGSIQLGNYVVTPFNSNVGPCPHNCDITPMGPGDDPSTESIEEEIFEEPTQEAVSLVVITKDEAEALIDDKQEVFQYLVYNDDLRQAMHYLKNSEIGEEIAYFRTYVGVQNIDGSEMYNFLTTGLNSDGDQIGDFIITPFDKKVGPCPHNCDFGS